MRPRRFASTAMRPASSPERRTRNPTPYSVVPPVLRRSPLQKSPVRYRLMLNTAIRLRHAVSVAVRDSRRGRALEGVDQPRELGLKIRHRIESARELEQFVLKFPGRFERAREPIEMELKSLRELR